MKIFLSLTLFIISSLITATRSQGDHMSAFLNTTDYSEPADIGNSQCCVPSGTIQLEDSVNGTIMNATLWVGNLCAELDLIYVSQLLMYGRLGYSQVSQLYLQTFPTSLHKNITAYFTNSTFPSYDKTWSGFFIDFVIDFSNYTSNRYSINGDVCKIRLTISSNILKISSTMMFALFAVFIV